MIKETGWIKLHRQIKHWEWFTDRNVLQVFIYCLSEANFEDGSFLGVKIPAGSFPTSYSKISGITKLSVDQVRYALKKLELTGELTHQNNGNFITISITKWHLFQGNSHEIPTSFPPVSHEIPNTIRKKEVKKIYNTNIAKSEKIEKDPDRAQSWYVGKVIKLNKGDYLDWLSLAGDDWSEHDFGNWLDSRDNWLDTQGAPVKKNWFMSTKAAIQKINRLDE